VSGAEVKAQVLERLRTYEWACADDGLPKAALDIAKTHDALVPCVVLTPGEAAKICGAMQLVSHGILTEKIAEEWAECRALLTPDPADDPENKAAASDTGPPAPGEGDELANPEMGMTC
jgi:hypothetical protein